MNVLQEAADRAAKAHRGTSTATGPHLVSAAPPAKPAQQSAAEKAWLLLDEFINILPTQFVGKYEKLVTEHFGARPKK